MPKKSIVVAHRLTPEEAQRRIQRLLPDLKQRYADQISDVHEQWTGNKADFAFKAREFSVSGTLTVKPRQVELVGNVPLAVMPFWGRIEATIRRRAELLLG
jgi:hypothetical protein